MKCTRFVLVGLAATVLCIGGTLGSLVTLATQRSRRTVEVGAYRGGPVKIVGVRVKDKPLSDKGTIEATADWVNDLTFTLRNVSEKPVAFAEVHLLVKKAGGGVSEKVGIARATYGPKPNPDGTSGGKVVPIAPGGEMQTKLEFGCGQATKLTEFIRQAPAEVPRDVTQISAFVGTVTFAGERDVMWYGHMRLIRAGEDSIDFVRDPDKSATDAMKEVKPFSPAASAVSGGQLSAFRFAPAAASSSAPSYLTQPRAAVDDCSHSYQALGWVGCLESDGIHTLFDSESRPCLAREGKFHNPPGTLDVIRFLDLSVCQKNVNSSSNAFCMGTTQFVNVPFGNPQCNVQQVAAYQITNQPSCTSAGYLWNFRNNTCHESAACPEQQYECPSGTSWDQFDCGCYPPALSPILIDIAGDGFELTGGAEGVNFNLDVNPPAEKLAWTVAGSDDAWLVLDRNGNGMIDDGREMFGNFTSQPDPPAGEEKNGFLALRHYDRRADGGNDDGRIADPDAVFPSLRLWQDKNRNGVSEPQELHTLAALGVARIDLDYKESRRKDAHGNQFKYRARVRDRRGAQVGRWAWDVFLMPGQ